CAFALSVLKLSVFLGPGFFQRHILVRYALSFIPTPLLHLLTHGTYAAALAASAPSSSKRDSRSPGHRSTTYPRTGRRTMNERICSHYLPL
ncbi:hypothetical protein H0H92_004674, partial [Tricholoma furcatifolium]